MNWLTDYVRPKLKELIHKEKKEVPDNLWHKCPGCEQMLFHRELSENLYVCQSCNHHLRISIKDRLELLFDGGAYKEISIPKVAQDPLKFKDSKKYTDRLKTYRDKTKRDDAMVVAAGTIGGKKVVISAFDFGFMGGSMGMAVGEGILKGAEEAVRTNAAFITIPASGGARMQEAILSLMQMPRTTIAVQMIREAKLPYIVLLTDPTTGGVSASFAMLGDIAIAEPKATIGFAGRRVIEETIRGKLPDGFQTSEYLLDHGMVDLVVDRKDLHDTLKKLLGHISK